MSLRKRPVVLVALGLYFGLSASTAAPITLEQMRERNLQLRLRCRELVGDGSERSPSVRFQCPSAEVHRVLEIPACFTAPEGSSRILSYNALLKSYGAEKLIRGVRLQGNPARIEYVVADLFFWGGLMDYLTEEWEKQVVCGPLVNFLREPVKPSLSD